MCMECVHLVGGVIAASSALLPPLYLKMRSLHRRKLQTPPEPSQAPQTPAPPSCSKCGVDMGQGIAFTQLPPGSRGCFGQAPAELVSCLKCPVCGHSETTPKLP